MRCANCYTKLSDTSKYCSNCGTQVPNTSICSKCGSKFTSGSKYCEKCGLPYAEKELIDAPVEDGFPWGKVSYNPIKWNPLGLTKWGTAIYAIVLVVVIAFLLIVTNQ